jgi:hypothetical protein
LRTSVCQEGSTDSEAREKKASTLHNGRKEEQMKKITAMMSRGKTTVVAVAVALVLVSAPAAFAANGDPWLLGSSNVATAITTLGGTLGVNGPMVRIANNNAGAGDTALDLRVQAGEAPLTVNRDTKVTNLNADKLDGLDSSALLKNAPYVKVNPAGPGTELPDDSRIQTTSCDPGDLALSGGVRNIGSGEVVVESFPEFGNNAWAVRIQNTDGTPSDFSATVSCLDL